MDLFMILAAWSCVRKRDNQPGDGAQQLRLVRDELQRHIMWTDGRCWQDRVEAIGIADNWIPLPKVRDGIIWDSDGNPFGQARGTIPT